MKITLDEIMQAFDDLIEGKKSRQEVADWATELMYGNDYHDLEYDPSSAEDKIRKSLEDLIRADVLNINGNYIYSIEDFADLKEKFDSRKMKITLSEIKQAFDDLIEEKKSREEVANWATKLQFAEDDHNLEYDPPSEENKIWDGIQYLTMVDALNVPDVNTDANYFYSSEDFIDWKTEISN